MQTAPVLLLLLGVWMQCASCAQPLLPFALPALGSGTHKVEMTTSAGTAVSCQFGFATGDAAATEQQQLVAKSAAEVFRELSGRCFRRAFGFWSYEVCVGQSIKQSSGAESFELGKYAEEKGGKQLFNMGTLCPPTNTPRRSELSLACSGQNQVMKVEEPQSCSYHVVLGSPLVCSRSELSYAMEGAAVPDEPWLLELAEMDDGLVACTVRNVDDLRKGGFHSSAARFSSFKLRLSSPTLEFDAVQTVARRGSRAPLQEGEVKAVEASTAIGVESAAAFPGGLEYASVIGVPRATK